MLERRVVGALQADLERKMVLLSGPRQCGKTTLVKAITRLQRGVYLSWDDPADRRIINAGTFDQDTPYAFQVSAVRGRERRDEDIGRTRLRHVWAGRLLASLP